MGAWLVAAWACWPVQARADGMGFRLVGGQADVRATAQRAVLWHRQGVWELHLQPVFEREAGAAAWVVPFPVLPSVSAGDPDFLDQLEVATSPVFMRVCRESSASCLGCGAADMGGGALLGGGASVRVWERGTLGALEYVVLSAGDGDDLVAWLQAEGFEVPAAAAGPLAELTAEGSFFFAARLGAGADPAVPLLPVRFSLPGLEPPSYPLRLTAVGVPAGHSLDLTLWLIFPGDEAWAPHGRAVLRPPLELADRAGLEAALDALFAGSPEGLALLFGGCLADVGAFEGQACDWMVGCLEYEALGLSRPAAWAPEFEALRTAYVARYQARLGPAGLASDLRFRSLPPGEYLEHANRTFHRYTCHEEGGATALAGLVALGLALRLRRRRR
jgi:hypothetical protein